MTWHTTARIVLGLSALALTRPVAAQTPPAGSACMPGMSMPGCPEPAPSGMHMGRTGLMSMQGMRPQTFLEEITHHATSGTSAEPNSTPTPMLMSQHGSWMLMFHGNVFLLEQQQTGPRGRSKLFSTNWFMPMAQREVGNGILSVRAMFSLEPGTVTKRRYPLLFQQGETAFGLPITDAQHPHDFVMELAALYDWKLGPSTLLSFYFAPIGDPALGPPSFAHRASALENPVAALGHHQQDSTHVAADVATVGLTHGWMRLEASGFHGREPDEYRWNIDQGKIDSWSARLSLQPGKNWSGQYSFARIRAPEQLAPDEDQQRVTASVSYNRPLAQGNWASTFIWGHTSPLQHGSTFDSYLLESTIRWSTRNHAWTRIESAERSTELLLGGQPASAGFTEASVGHVEAYTFGYDRDFDLVPHLASALGAQVTTYTVPGTLKPLYGSHPAGVTVFLRLRPFSGEDR